MMIENIKKIFFNKMQPESEKSTKVDSKSVSIAACALLLEMAYADSEFTEHEKTNIISILEEEYELDDDDARELITIADQERKESLDLWQFTNLINQNYSHEDKIRVVETLWHVIYADGKVDKHEEYLMRKLTFLLDLEHKDMIEAKLTARERN